ncbi:MAG: CPBP family intramembrane glutamic endopeptidase [Bacillota bacterium]
MDKDKEIIEFEDLFKTVPQNKKTNKYQPENRNHYMKAIIYYLIVMFVIASVFYLIMGNIQEFSHTYTENELIFENIAYDTQGIAILDEYAYNYYKEPYTDFIIEVDQYQGYVIIVNVNNTYYDSILFIEDPLSGEMVLNEEAITGIFGTDMTITTWDNATYTINIYAGKSQTLPSFFMADYYEVEGPITDLSEFGSALLNFLIYLTLLPVLILLLKFEFVGDFKEFKVIKNQWISIIVIGYLYLMLGNILSGYASDFLGDLFNLAPAEAVNQMTIIRALNSSGAIFMVLSAVVMGPIVEELVFRKSIFGLFKSDKMGLVVSSVLFGSIHLIGEVSILAALVNGISYFVMGFIFGYIYLKNNRNIMAPIAVHILSNLISIVALLLIL